MERNTLSCFISDHEGFNGTIKNSPQDFVVIEIDTNGQFVNSVNTEEEERPCQTTKRIGKLKPSKPDDTDSLIQDCFDLNLILGLSVNRELEHFTNKLKVKPCSDDQEKVELSLGTFPDKHMRAVVHKAVRFNFPFLQTLTNQSEIRVREDPDFQELAGLASEGEAEDFFRFIDAKTPGSVFTFLPDDSKEHRTSVHHFVSRRFGKLVETKSFVDQQKTCITVRLRERGKQAKKRTMADCQMQEESLYTAFTLRKENLETLEAISYMAAVLGVLPSDFTYAGIKDKRAITYQAMVVKKISPERLLEKGSEFERRGMEISRVRPAFEALKLGRLQGNHFELVIRDLKHHGKHGLAELPKVIEEAVENVKNKGFVNYYGPQRFGSGSCVQADQVGLALLKENMEASVKLFFTPEDDDDLQNKAKRHFLHTGNAKESLVLMPAYKARERLMLRALHRYGSGQEGCTRGWLSLPHSMRVFYLHSYCSRVWNQAAKYRLQKLGFKPVQGDLVWAEPVKGLKDATEELSAPQIHVVTSDEEKNEVFSLDQVILPMPGNSVKYPENLLGQWYQDRLAQDGLESCRFRVTPLKLNVPGCYRPLLAKPQNITYSLQTSSSDESNTHCLSLNFDLEASCYATVCLGEIMKTNLS
ncbi:pseudouridylate synthase PUS7L [Danio rerio]|uniref:Pseudouridylate synthase PUS7L n=2 Tax=Danio rerio TaxID=7955 RepID=PUS7L_DANRE|nr:pseudouridylate synthase PUS7L [Danio rerio]Q1L8I0.1 RecName: Full=Pseudouridylate synthase PUS7L; AltName: Full=Pseudouridylate synthase 7 homolog-like protein [Danio rerio]|eukprot:NP_001038422.1 pseudouridylate synthase 7 homolog-like protein [Danio rerio]